MDLTAREVQEKRFHDAWRGYNQEEVDDFLDRVAETVAHLERDNTVLQARVRELDQMLDASRSTEEMLKKTLVTAQQAAEEAISAAREKAEQLVAEAEARAGRANEELRRRVETAEEEVRQRTAEAEARAKERQQSLQLAIDRLQGFETEIKRRLRAFLEMQLKTLDGIDEQMQRPAQAVARVAPQAQPQTTHEEPAAVPSAGSDAAAEPADEMPVPAEDAGVDITDERTEAYDDAADEVVRRRALRGIFRRDVREPEEAPQTRA